MEAKLLSSATIIPRIRALLNDSYHKQNTNSKLIRSATSAKHDPGRPLELFLCQLPALFFPGGEVLLFFFLRLHSIGVGVVTSFVIR
jgi:hypothetical protein